MPATYPSLVWMAITDSAAYEDGPVIIPRNWHGAFTDRTEFEGWSQEHCLWQKSRQLEHLSYKGTNSNCTVAKFGIAAGLETRVSWVRIPPFNGALFNFIKVPTAKQE